MALLFTNILSPFHFCGLHVSTHHWLWYWPCNMLGPMECKQIWQMLHPLRSIASFSQLSCSSSLSPKKTKTKQKKSYSKQGLLLCLGLGMRKHQVKSQQPIQLCMYFKQEINDCYCKLLILGGYFLLLQRQISFYSHLGIKSIAICIWSTFLWIFYPFLYFYTTTTLITFNITHPSNDCSFLCLSYSLVSGLSRWLFLKWTLTISLPYSNIIKESPRGRGREGLTEN